MKKAFEQIENETPAFTHKREWYFSSLVYLLYNVEASMTFLFVFKTSLVFQNTGAYDLHRLVNVSPLNVHVSTLNLVSLTTSDSIVQTINSGTIASHFETFGV